MSYYITSNETKLPIFIIVRSFIFWPNMLFSEKKGSNSKMRANETKKDTHFWTIPVLGLFKGKVI